MAALFRRRQLIFKVNAGRSRLDHSLHQFEGIQGSAESGLSVGYQRREPCLSRRNFALCVMNLIRSLQRIVDPPAESRHAVSWIQTLVGIHGSSIICIGGDLPSADVNRLESRLHLLYSLIATHRPERVYVTLGLQ